MERLLITAVTVSVLAALGAVALSSGDPDGLRARKRSAADVRLQAR
jgi:hypothetical protein